MNPPMNLDRKITVSPEVLYQEIDGEIVLLDLKSESYFGLDEVGARFWQLVERQKDFESVFEILLSEYEVEPERLRADLEQLVGELENAGLVVSGGA